MAELDPREIERRLAKLEENMLKVLEALRQREEGYGSVRAAAERVPALIEEMRELRKVRGEGRGASVLPPPPAPVVQSTSAPVDTNAIVRRLSEMVLSKGSLPTIDDLRRVAKEETGTQLRALVNVDQLAERMWKEITATGVEERLAKLLLDRVGREVDTKVVIRQLIEEIIARIDVASLTGPVTAGVVEKLAASYQLAKKSSY